MGQYRCPALVLAVACIPVAPWTSADPGKDQRPRTDYPDKDYASELPRVLPKTPAESLKALRVHSGFRVELVAAEPLLASPVALDFDEDGRLYVVEYPEYNQYASKQPQGHGRVRLLEDTHGDGVYDKSTIFLDNLDSPTAVCCYDGGVFVGAAPNILYAKDTDGDGKADVRRVVYTGFARDASGDAMFNSFRWLLDNRIHVQTSWSGGAVRHVARSPDRATEKPVSVRGQLFVFDPRTEKFEVTSGGGQHGLSMDDWGRLFVCTNSQPVQQIMYDGRYLARNPYLEAPAAAVSIGPGGYTSKVFRISPNEPWRVLRTRMRTTGVALPNTSEGAEPSGYFTSASGVTVYRGDAWPAEYRGDVFVGEVANNLLYHAHLVPNGVGLSALRADRNVEFLASTDIWSRPVQMANGPDGTLYVVDMYRNLIEGAAFLPPAIVKHLDVSGGFDKGRLYRIVPEGFHRRRTPRLGKATTAELVALLEHANGWHRDTASRLLYQRQDRAAVAPLRRLAAGSRSPLGRMHALYALDGLKALDADMVLHGLRDPDAHVREHALRLAEQFAFDPEVRAQLVRMTDDPVLGVRYQLAFSLGAVPGDLPNHALARLARRDGGDPWCRLAVLSSVNTRAGDVFRLVLGDRDYRATDHGREMLGALATLIGSANRPKEVAAAVGGLNALPDGEEPLFRDLVRHLVTKLPASGRGQLADAGKAGDVLAELLRDARKTAPDRKRPVADRVAAIHLLGLAAFGEVRDLARQLLEFRQPPPVQAAAVELLSHFDQPAVPGILLEAWPGLSPPLRARAVEAFFSRPAWSAAFLDAVEHGTVNRGDVDPARVQALQAHGDRRLRARAAKLFASAKLARRQDVVAAYQKALRLKGDRARGKAVFKKVCSSCHELEGVGTQVGADLHAIRDQGTATILLNILDPNREVKPQFLSYVVMTDAGRMVTGMITAETANSLTIRRADGTAETVLRIHIDEMRSTGLSFMPEGLEKQIDVQAMADCTGSMRSGSISFAGLVPGAARTGAPVTGFAPSRPPRTSRPRMRPILPAALG
jgi:putative membrane-bound dehydrogenase-like protein